MSTRQQSPQQACFCHLVWLREKQGLLTRAVAAPVCHPSNQGDGGKSARKSSPAGTAATVWLRETLSQNYKSNELKVSLSGRVLSWPGQGPELNPQHHRNKNQKIS